MTPSATPTLIVLAEVLNAAAAVPPPGVVHALQVDRYRVLKVISGDYQWPDLFAAREAGAPFQTGARLRLTLTSHLPEGTAPLITTPAEVARRGLFYCVTFAPST